MPIGGNDSKPAAAKTAPKKTAAPKAGSNKVEYEVRGRALGTVKVEGTVDAINAGFIRIQHRRPGSSKLVLTPIPLSKVLMIRNDPKVGKFVQVTYESQDATFVRLRRAEVGSQVDEALGMLKGTDENGQTFYMRPESCLASTTSDITAKGADPIKF